MGLRFTEGDENTAITQSSPSRAVTVRERSFQGSGFLYRRIRCDMPLPRREQGVDLGQV